MYRNCEIHTEFSRKIEIKSFVRSTTSSMFANYSMLLWHSNSSPFPNVARMWNLYETKLRTTNNFQENALCLFVVGHIVLSEQLIFMVLRGWCYKIRTIHPDYDTNYKYSLADAWHRNTNNLSRHRPQKPENYVYIGALPTERNYENESNDHRMSDTQELSLCPRYGIWQYVQHVNSMHHTYWQSKP